MGSGLGRPGFKFSLSQIRLKLAPPLEGRKRDPVEIMRVMDFSLFVISPII